MSVHAHEQLMTQLADPAARAKIAAYGSKVVRDRLREASFAEAVIPPEDVDRSQCQTSPNHDGLIKMVPIEPTSRAMAMTFRGTPNVTFIRGQRVECAFYTIMSDMFQKPEQEFLAYDFPIAKVIEDNSVRDIGEIYDREFTIHIESAVQALQAEANGGSVTTLNATALQGGAPPAEFSVAKGELARVATTDNATVLPLQKPDIVRLKKLLDGRYLETKRLLLSKQDINDVLSWTVEDQGDKIQSETVVNGYKYNLLLGLEYVATIKTDVLRPGNVYAFTTPEFLGRAYVLNRVKFWIDKVINLLKFVCWKDVGMVIANIASVTKLELYSGDATSLDADGIVAAGSVTPKAEGSMFAANNRAANRQFYPAIPFY